MSGRFWRAAHVRACIATTRCLLAAGAGCAELAGPEADLGSARTALSLPDTPRITEPSQDDKILNGADVHMETAPFSDADPGQAHRCTDWEIWRAAPRERVWLTACVGGIERVHTHLGDGVFEGSLAGQRELAPNTAYLLRVRHRDDSGDPATEWSAYAERPFRTAEIRPPLPGAPEWLVAYGYAVDEVVSGLSLPVNIAFPPEPAADGAAPLLYVAELYGTIKVVSGDLSVSVYARDLLNFDPTGNFPGTGEQGLVGLVVEPETGDLFASLLYDAGGPHYPKVVRFHSDDGGLTARSMTTVLDLAGEVQGQSHQISHLSFGPDQKLYVHMGDGFDAARALDLDSARGKVLRMNLDGSAPSDNPFYSAADGVSARDYVFAYGLRNPFGGAWHLAEGAHYSVENGPSVDRFARIERGQSYGYDGSDASMRTRALYNWPTVKAPVNVAFVEHARFHGSGFPDDVLGHAFVTESGPTYASGPQGKRLSEFALDASYRLRGEPTSFVAYNGTGKSTFAALAAGPDGLYFSGLYPDDPALAPSDPGAKIYRVRYVGRPTVDPSSFTAEYFADTTFTSLRLVRAEPRIDFEWGDGSPASDLPVNDFSARFTGVIRPRFSETYTLSTITDDGARLWLDDVLLIDDWTNHAAIERTATVSLIAGRSYFLRMEYYENGGGAVAKLLWSSASEPRGTVTPGGPERAPGLLATYYDGIDFAREALVRVDPQVDFYFHHDAPAPQLGADHFSVRWSGFLTAPTSGTYTLTTRSDDGVRLVVDGRTVIDDWTLHASRDDSATVTLEANRAVPITLEYFENTGGALISLLWSGPTLLLQPVPSAALSHAP